MKWNIFLFTKLHTKQARPKNTSIPPKDALDNKEQPTESTVGGAGTSPTVGVTAPFINQMSVSTTLVEVMVPPP